MSFNSPLFLFCFLPLVYILVRLMPSIKIKNILLALASLVFYAFGQLSCLPLLIGSIAVNYVFGRILGSGNVHVSVPCRKIVLAAGVTLNIAFLGLFKYAGFFVSTLNSLFGLSLAAPSLALPIGISFFTFKGLSYLIDIYRNPGCASKNFINLLLYVSFFPQLLAGPIVQYKDAILQIENRNLSPEKTVSGLKRFIAGFAKKMILAETARGLSDAVFAMSAAELNICSAWLGAAAYTLRIFFDFAGYSDMAIGLGRLFGFDCKENFGLPLKARSIKEFWRGWHISLSSWFRDYLYIPLGGNRKGKGRTMLNKFIVFAVTGLWHGANWTFILWGLWHGLFSVLEESGIIPEKLRKSKLGAVYAQLVVILGFTLFGADSLPAAGRMFAAMFTGFSFAGAKMLSFIGLLNVRTVFLLIAAIFAAKGGFAKISAWADTYTFFEKHKTKIEIALYSLLFVWSIITMISTGFTPFIYFQF